MPKAVGEVRKLTGLLSYYRRYIRDFAKIAKPLIDPIKEPTANLEEKEKYKTSQE